MKTLFALFFGLILAIAPAGAASAAQPDRSASAVAVAQADKTAPVTPATEFHGLPGNNAGFSDQAKGAAPAGTAPGADGGIHGIATNPGQSGVSPQDRNEPPSCDMHAGIDAVNGNCVE